MRCYICNECEETGSTRKMKWDVAMKGYICDECDDSWRESNVEFEDDELEGPEFLEEFGME